MFQNKVEICGVNTAKLTVLSDSEKYELLMCAKNGDLDARRKMIDGNLRLVLSIIQRFTNRRENLDDLFQVGCVGLIKAVDNFDTSLQVKFSTYAVPMIIGEIRRYLRDYNSIRVSRSVRDLAYRALSVREALSKKSGTEPTLDEISRELGAEPADVSAAFEAIIEPVSLYEPIYNDGSEAIFLMDQLSDDKCTDESWCEDIALKEALKKLTNREKAIIDMRFFRCRTQMEIAEEIGISQAQVSRLEKGAIDHIRQSMAESKT